MEQLLEAILNDDLSRVIKILKSDPSLATRLITEPRLYEKKILHWIYARDTALHLAAAGHRFELVQLLLAAGADPNSAKNHRQSGPLHYAADGYINSRDFNPANQVKTIEALLKAGAKINAQDKNGATPLHRAVRTRCAAAVKFLLEQGSDPKLKNKPGSSPFHLAVQNTARGGAGAAPAKTAQRQIIQHFLSLGLTANLKDGKGKSVIDCARSGWIKDMVASR